MQVTLACVDHVFLPCMPGQAYPVQHIMITGRPQTHPCLVVDCMPVTQQATVTRLWYEVLRCHAQHGLCYPDAASAQHGTR